MDRAAKSTGGAARYALLGLLALCAAPESLLAAKARATLVVTSSVDGATVEIDGKVVGKTPIKVQSVSAGRHTVKVRRLGHVEHAEEITAAAGRSVQVFADLLPFAGVVAVSCNVSGALVLVDGKVVGKAPLEFEVKVGKRVLSVSAKGYVTFTETLNVEPGAAYPFAVALTKGKGGALDELELELEPLAKAAPPQDGLGGLELELEPLAKADAAAKREGPLTPPSEAPSVAVAGPEPWYKRYWVWGAAAAVVTGGVVTAILLTSGDDKPGKVIDAGWRPGEGQFDPNAQALRFAH